MAIAIAPTFHETPDLAAALEQFDGTIPTVDDVPEPGMVPEDQLNQSLFASFIEAQPVWPTVDELLAEAGLSVEQIEADYDELYPSKVVLSDALQEALLEMSIRRGLEDVAAGRFRQIPEITEGVEIDPESATLVMAPVDSPDFADAFAQALHDSAQDLVHGPENA